MADLVSSCAQVDLHLPRPPHPSHDTLPCSLDTSGPHRAGFTANPSWQYVEEDGVKKADLCSKDPPSDRLKHSPKVPRSLDRSTLSSFLEPRNASTGSVGATPVSTQIVLCNRQTPQRGLQASGITIAHLPISPCTMSEVALRPVPSSFPRPTSLYLPDLTVSTQSLVRSSSYSPFPTIPGASHDPHNLDRFLLPPDDPSWLYTLPPAADAMLPLATPIKGSDQSSVGHGGVKKISSSSMLHRSSPLSQPPVSGGEQEEDVMQRKRSNSVDSLSSPVEATGDADTLGLEASTGNIRSTGRSSIRQAFHLRRRSVLTMSEAVADSTATTPLSTPSSFSSSAGDPDSTTPMSSRSHSQSSEMSSASSSSSSDGGVKTPSEVSVPQIDVEIAGGKLAVALAAAGDKKNRKNTWRGWLGGRRATKATASGASTPPFESSAETSPNLSTSTVNKVPQLTLTPSPDIIDATEVVSIVASEPSERSVTRGMTIEQMRRISISKMTQLRSPSPHPLALALRRQYSNLPDEIALSIQSGQKVFPRSVNILDRTAGLNPMQNGLITSLAVKMVMQKLERGEYPETSLNARRSTDPLFVTRPRGVLDFVDRPPFEERNIVFYPNGSCSPISMARPGFGIWDLDFSSYILALSKIDSAPSAPWPTLPRASVGPSLDGFEDVLAVVKRPQPSPESEQEEVLVSPGPVVVVLDDILPIKQDVEVEEPVSSFRSVKTVSESSVESSDEDEEEDDDDNSPLASVFPKRNMSSNALLAHPAPPIRHERSRSTPNTKRVSIVDDQITKQLAMDEVARARERRQANLSGETDRRAEAERHHCQPAPTAYKRSSTMNITANRSSSNLNLAETRHASPPAASREARRRTHSSYEVSNGPRPDAPRRPSAPEGMPAKRFHSFYEAPVLPQPHVYPQVQSPMQTQMFMPMYPPQIYGHSGMHAFPGMAAGPSMLFPHQAYMRPEMQMHMPMQMQQQNPAMYLQMQGRQSRSSLVVPSPSRPGHSQRPSSTHQTSRPRPSRLA